MNEICANCGHHKDDHTHDGSECNMPECDCTGYEEQETE